MIWFSQRRMIEEAFIAWADENGVAKVPNAVVAFLGIQGCLDEDAVNKTFPMTAADVQPVRHGWWIKSKIPDEKFVCSECGGACWYYDYEGEVARSRYCPNCGAKMDLTNNKL